MHKSPSFLLGHSSLDLIPRFLSWCFPTKAYMGSSRGDIAWERVLTYLENRRTRSGLYIQCSLQHRSPQPFATTGSVLFMFIQSQTKIGARYPVWALKSESLHLLGQTWRGLRTACGRAIPHTSNAQWKNSQDDQNDFLDEMTAYILNQRCAWAD